MSNIEELRLAGSDEERIDLIDVFKWVFDENQILDHQVAVKAYASLPHGQPQQAVEALVHISDLRNEVNQFRRRVSKQVNWPAWSTAISSVLVGEDGVPRSFIPVMDLEIDATEDIPADLKNIDVNLITMGCSGMFIRSGDVGSGSYFFVGDKPWNYPDGYIKYFGLMMVVMVDWQATGDEASSNRLTSLRLGERVLGTNTIEEAKAVAQDILIEFPSTPSGARRPGLQLDPRWAARRFIEERTYLRYTPGKGYEDKPRLVAELY